MTSAPTTRQPGDDRWAPEVFIEHLAAGWQLGDADAFVAHFRPNFHLEVRSKQPLSKPQIGFDALQKQFHNIFALLPGVTATISAWAAAEPHVYVEFEITADLRGHILLMASCDRFTFAEGKITERSVYFDPTILLGFLLRHPKSWPRLLRAR